MRSKKVQLWSRDEAILREIGRSPMLRNQVGRLLGFPPKKDAERLCDLYRAGHVKRVPYFQPGMQGRTEFAYYQGSCPSAISLRHTIAVAELYVQSTISFPEDQAQFFYGHELAIRDLRPDAGMIVQRGEKTALLFFEADCGTERLTSPSSYSLLGKLRTYAVYFDSGQYAKDFSWAGLLKGFRVGLVLSSALRLTNIQRLVRSERLDFVLLATMEALSNGLQHPVWQSHDGRTVDLFGREKIYASE